MWQHVIDSRLFCSSNSFAAVLHPLAKPCLPCKYSWWAEGRQGHQCFCWQTQRKQLKLDTVATDLLWQRAEELSVTKDPKGKWELLASMIHSIYTARAVPACSVISCLKTVFFSYLLFLSSIVWLVFFLFTFLGVCLFLPAVPWCLKHCISAKLVKLVSKQKCQKFST